MHILVSVVKPYGYQGFFVTSATKGGWGHQWRHDYSYHGQELRPPSAPSPWRHWTCGTPCQTQFASVTSSRRLSTDLKPIFLQPLLINLPVDQAPLLPAHVAFYGAIKFFIVSYRIVHNTPCMHKLKHSALSHSDEYPELSDMIMVTRLAALPLRM